MQAHRRAAREENTSLHMFVYIMLQFATFRACTPPNAWGSPPLEMIYELGRFDFFVSLHLYLGAVRIRSATYYRVDGVFGVGNYDEAEGQNQEMQNKCFPRVEAKSEFPNRWATDP